MSARDLLNAHREATPVRVGWRTNLPPAWDFDLDAIAQAARELALRLPVVVGCAEYRRRTSGTAGCERDEHGRWYHRIAVRRATTALAASEIIWHELAHAAQAEQVGPEHFDVAYSRAGGRKGAGYRTNPYEIEARAHERRADTHPLVRRRAA